MSKSSDSDDGKTVIKQTKVIRKEIIPSLSELGIAWITKLRPIATKGPFAFVRSVIVSFIVKPTVRTILGIGATLISAVLLLFRGSQPGFSRNEEILGLADLAPFVFDLLVGIGEWTISTWFDVLTGATRAVIPQTPGPFDAVAVNVLVAGITVAVVIGGGRLLLALIDSIPVIGGVTELVG